MTWNQAMLAEAQGWGHMEIGRRPHHARPHLLGAVRPEARRSRNTWSIQNLQRHVFKSKWRCTACVPEGPKLDLTLIDSETTRWELATEAKVCRKGDFDRYAAVCFAKNALGKVVKSCFLEWKTSML